MRPKTHIKAHKSAGKLKGHSSSRDSANASSSGLAQTEAWQEHYPSPSPDSRHLLQALHLLTRDGQLNQDARRKLKQVAHLAQFARPLLDGAKTLVDFGSGKNYLGLILYDLYLRDPSEVELWSVEARPELVNASRELATRLKFSRTHFLEAKIAEASAKLPAQFDLLLALHACDTATDDAIICGLRHQARAMLLVPCCQAEAARELDQLSTPSHSALQSLWAHGIHRREFGSHLTNVIRALALEAHGYKVRCTEFVGLEHSMKNELIIAERHQRRNPRAERELAALLEAFPIRLRLLDELQRLAVVEASDH
ncbi:MAG TPA: SAM-dependent methyltransferase [Pseudobdellovibrionaceae bacterium]|nr:SAM-dependent methyltransferase [Pseudobdellovibrionaceae bacterium]